MIDSYTRAVPRQVDHTERRGAIADAVARLVVAHGLEAVTMRRVATAAGMSLGQVQHYFPSKDELLRFAAGAIGARTAAPRQERDTDLDTDLDTDGADPGRGVRDLLVARLPLDERRVDDAHVGLAFLARAASAPDLAKELRAGHDELEQALVTELRRAQRAGSVRLDLDPRRAAGTLLAVVDGLTAHVLVGHRTPAEALEALEAHVDELFGA